MDKVFKKKNDIPHPPKLPAPSQIVDDLKSSPADDPVFYGLVKLAKLFGCQERDFENVADWTSLVANDQETSITLHKTKGDNDFHTAKDFMTSTAKLKEVEQLLVLQKAQLEESYKELQMMSENIRQQATDALSSIY